jgi:Zn-finger nucleic acid-binding protein
VSALGARQLRCQKCKGLWLGHGEVAKILEDAGAEQSSPLSMYTDQIEKSALVCPHCGEGLDRHLVDKVELDACAGHGLWFDRDELGKILGNFASTQEQDAADPLDVRNSLAELVASFFERLVFRRGKEPPT